MFLVGLSRTARNGKQTKDTLAEKKKKKIGYIYTMECYSEVKKTDKKFEDKWMELETKISYLRYVRPRKVNTAYVHLQVDNCFLLNDNHSRIHRLRKIK